MAYGLADFGAIRSAFGNRNFAIYTAGSAVTLVGLWVQRLGVGWLTWELTHSGFWLGVVAFADLFPAVVVGPFAGVLADRLDRLRLALVCQGLSLLQTALLFALTLGGLIEIVSLIILTGFLGAVRAVYMPVRLSLVPSLVRADDVPAAVAISSLIFNLALFLGPALAGLIITAWGVAPTFAVYAVTVVALLVALTRLRVDRGVVAGRRDAGMLAEIAEGVRYTIGHPAVGPLLLLMLTLSLLARPLGELLPGFADVVFGRGAGGLAALTSAVGVGAVVGGAWLAKRGSAAGLLTIALLGGGGCAVSVLLFTGTSLFWVGVAAAAVFGGATVASAIATQTLILGAVDDAVRGRVLSLYGVIFRGGPAVGSLVMGALSGPFGLRLPLAVGGLLCLVATALLWRRRRRLIVLLERAGPRRVGAE
jgi:predicted MFS family arabinose efflux permease